MPPSKKITIHIDRKRYEAPGSPISGAAVRVLADPDVGDDRDLYLVVPGPRDDLLVGNDDQVKIKDGDRFFTAPRTINPGR